MAGMNMTGDIGSLLSFYKLERNIYGRCLHCSEPFRLSEVKLTYGKEAPRDVLAQLTRDRDKNVEENDIKVARLEDALYLAVNRRLGSRVKRIRSKREG
jgi:hypothetical protein